MKVLVTGGAGFIGSHLVDRLIERGDQVTVIDSLVEQVHGKIEPGDWPRHLNRYANFVRADIRDVRKLREALRGAEVVFHMAAEVGVGQSMSEVERYVGGNTYATSILLNMLANERTAVKRLIVS